MVLAIFMAHHFTKSVKKGSRCNVPLLRVCYIVNFSPSFFCLNCCVMMQKWNKILGLAIVTDLFIHSNRVQPIRMPNRWELKAKNLCSFIFFSVRGYGSGLYESHHFNSGIEWKFVFTEFFH